MRSNDFLSEDQMAELQTRNYQPGQLMSVLGVVAPVVSGTPVKSVQVMRTRDGQTYVVVPEGAYGTIVRQHEQGRAGYDVALPLLAENGESLVVSLSPWNMEPNTEEEARGEP